MVDEKIVYLPRPGRPRKEPFFGWLSHPTLRHILALLKQMLPIPSYLIDYTGPFLVTVSRLIEDEKYGEALALSHQGLEKCGETTDGKMRSRWWQFLSCAVHCAEMLDDVEEKERLLSLAGAGSVPEKGRNVAYCFSYFSRWKYAEYDYDKAIEHAETAREADTTFAEVHFLLGWYTLFIRQSDPIDHFRTAIEKDPEYLVKITHDPEIANFPHIIKKLRQPTLLSRPRD